MSRTEKWEEQAAAVVSGLVDRGTPDEIAAALLYVICAGHLPAEPEAAAHRVIELAERRSTEGR